MSDRMKPLLGAAVASTIVNFVTTTYLYAPIAAEDMPAGALVPAWLALVLTAVVLVFLFDWINQSVGNPIKSALIISCSQIVLVDVLYVLNGSRGITAAVVSAVVLLVGACTFGFVYGKLSDG